MIFKYDYHFLTVVAVEITPISLKISQSFNNQQIFNVDFVCTLWYRIQLAVNTCSDTSRSDDSVVGVMRIFFSFYRGFLVPTEVGLDR